MGVEAMDGIQILERGFPMKPMRIRGSGLLAVGSWAAPWLRSTAYRPLEP